jgi:hypothetical protein
VDRSDSRRLRRCRNRESHPGGIAIILTLGLAAVIVWPISMLWGAIAASNKHSKYQAWLA